MIIPRKNAEACRRRQRVDLVLGFVTAIQLACDGMGQRLNAAKVPLDEGRDIPEGIKVICRTTSDLAKRITQEGVNRGN